jgi:hypothetical protein
MTQERALLIQVCLAAVTTLSTVILVGVTARYAVLTNRLARTAAQQTFDGMFLELRAGLADVTSHFSAVLDGHAVTGRDAFEQAVGLIVGQLSVLAPLPVDKEPLRVSIDTVYRRTCQITGSDFGHYFRRLFYLLKFIDDSTLLPEDKYRYVSIVRGDFSTGELNLLAFNCISVLGQDRFRELVERYSLFAGMRYAHDIVRQNVLLFFERKAITANAA